MKHNRLMPGYYRKNIARNAQRKFFQRKAKEREQAKAVLMGGEPQKEKTGQ